MAMVYAQQQQLITQQAKQIARLQRQQLQLAQQAAVVQQPQRIVTMGRTPVQARLGGKLLRKKATGIVNRAKQQRFGQRQAAARRTSFTAGVQNRRLSDTMTRRRLSMESVNSNGSNRGVRGLRGGRGGRGGARGGGRVFSFKQRFSSTKQTPPKTKEQLDSELDTYHKRASLTSA
eukprot:gnl/Hemi2/18895_TR6258_c0_g1_i1.p2 gnl/Hemi2/18895_TR6258_c0_g1~~gnl/Hemi2/18895_TR6258_c0_g1_i1.p2  ORF type:complete len:191 (+),score=66.28 gnl/Hemi2/18895_TR6258_c0_g1_i1:46-573(+)